MNVLVIGASGFVGKELLSRFESLGGYKVTTVSRASNGLDDSHICCDLTCRRQVQRSFGGKSFDAVIYLAGVTSSAASDCHYKTSFDGVLNLLECLDLFEATRFIYMSSAEIYGLESTSASEDRPVRPNTDYGLAKLCGEMLVRTYSNSLDQLSSIILRPSLIFGHNENPRFFLHQAVQCMASNMCFKMSAGEQTRDFISVVDVVESIFAALSAKCESVEIFNVSYGSSLTLKEVALNIREILHSRSEIEFGALPYRDGEIMKFDIPNYKLKRELMWSPSISLYEWLSETFGVKND